MLIDDQKRMEDGLNINHLLIQIQDVVEEKGRCIVAIDGRAAAGKSTLAAYLEREIGASVIHMDDFFLPMELRTKERYMLPGGNVHYERFHADVTRKLLENRPFQYQRFNCKIMQLDTWQVVDNHKVIVIEGAYSTHPNILLPYDLTVFLHIDKEEQRQRILSRNGTEALNQFKERWIPLEEEYFKAYKVQKSCNFIMELN